MASAGVQDDTINYRGFNVKAEVDHSYGAFLKPKYAVTKELEVFARLGYTQTKVKLSAAGIGNFSDTSDDFSWGLGAQYSITPKVYVTGSYMQVTNDDKGWNLGLGMKF